MARPNFVAGGRGWNTSTFHLVRHGHTEALGRTLTGRSPGVGLSGTGEAEAEAVAARLSREAIGAVLHSPQLRTTQTAEAIAGRAGLAAAPCAGLDEVDFGAWSGVGFPQLEGDPGWAAWNGFRSLAPTPGGETMLAVQARAVAVLQGLHASEPGRTVVLVSHADVIRAVLAYVLGMAIDLMRRLDIQPASRSVVTLRDADLSVTAVNLPPGL